MVLSTIAIIYIIIRYTAFVDIPICINFIYFFIAWNYMLKHKARSLCKKEDRQREQYTILGAESLHKNCPYQVHE